MSLSHFRATTGAFHKKNAPSRLRENILATDGTFEREYPTQYEKIKRRPMDQRIRQSDFPVWNQIPNDDHKDGIKKECKNIKHSEPFKLVPTIFQSRLLSAHGKTCCPLPFVTVTGDRPTVEPPTNPNTDRPNEGPAIPNVGPDFRRTRRSRSGNRVSRKNWSAFFSASTKPALVCSRRLKAGRCIKARSFGS